MDQYDELMNRLVLAMDSLTSLSVLVPTAPYPPIEKGNRGSKDISFVNEFSKIL